MKLLRRIFIGLGVTGFILAAGAVLIFNRPTLGWQALSVPTGSMRPTFNPGALVLTHRVPIQSLKVGDIITYTNPLTMHSTLTHRIIRVYKIDGKIPAFITKGDANPSPDVPVVAGLVKGQMVWHVAYVGSALMWAKTWVGIATLIYLPALLIMISETRRMAVYLRQIKPYYLEGWRPKRREQKLRAKPAMAVSIALAVAVAGVGWQTAGAIAAPVQSNTVMLSPNVLTANIKQPPPSTSCNNNSNVHVGNSTTQTSSSGNATTTGGGKATSGNSSNNNNTNVNITITQC